MNMHSNRVIFFYLLVCWFVLYVHAKEFVLITTLYNEVHHERAQEYIECLEKNSVHPLIKKIHVLYDTSKDEIRPSLVHAYLKEHADINISYIEGRASFSQLFDLASKVYSDEFILVSNGDIYFNETLDLLDTIDFKDVAFAMGRWEVNSDGTLSIAHEHIAINGQPIFQIASCSQDVWVFKSPMRVVADDIFLGTPYCDHYIAYRLMAAGYAVYNPALSLQCCHNHRSNMRNYEPGGGHCMETAAVPACHIGDVGDISKAAVQTYYRCRGACLQCH